MKGVPIAVFGAKGTSEFITEFISDENTVDPTIEDSYYKNLNIDGKEVQINILDTAGQDDFSPLRTSHMRQGKGFIFLYNIDDRESFTETEAFYHDLTRVKGTNDVPFVICGNEANPDAKRTVSKEEGEALADKCNAGFFETSPFKKINIKEPFVEIIRRALKVENNSPPPPEKKEKKKKFSLFKKKKE